MSDSVDALLFLGAISAVMTWFSTTIASALSQLVFRILAGAVLSAVLSVREASYNCFVIGRSAESGGSSKLYSTVVSLLSYRRLILRMLATCSFPMSSHMYLCTTCCTERWLWSTMPSMDCRKGFIPCLMRGFEGFLLQGFPESPWGYVPRIVH